MTRLELISLFYLAIYWAREHETSYLYGSIIVLVQLAFGYLSYLYGSIIVLVQLAFGYLSAKAIWNTVYY
jgi:hypothetical protein